MAASAPQPSAAQSADALVELSSRLVFSLLKAAVRVAARFEMPMNRLVELVRLAYFAELRRGAPRDLAGTARRLGLSIRTAGTLNRQLRGGFFAPENEVQPLRRVTGVLIEGASTHEPLDAPLPDVDSATVERALNLLVKNGWVDVSGGHYYIRPENRSFVGSDLERRVDGLNHQLEVMSESVWGRFVEQDVETASGRTWVVAAKPEEFAAFVQNSIKDMRHRAVEVEESALSAGVHDRYAVTMAFAPLPEHD